MLIATLTFLLLGIALATRGLIGRRIGDEPRCRKCKYNLTGVESKECPECGRPWTGETAARGLRKWRVGPLVLATPFLFAGCALFLPPVRSWIGSPAMYRIAPEWFVVQAAERGSLTAQFEIHDRATNQKLTANGMRRVVALGLAQLTLHGLLKARPWGELLNQLEMNGALNESERDAYFGQLAMLQLETRPQIRGYEQLPYRLTVTASSMPSLAMFVFAEFQSVTAGPEKLLLDFSSVPSVRPLFGDQCLNAQTIRSYLKPGQYDLEFRIALKFYGSPQDSPRSSTPRFVATRTLHRPLEVLDRNGRDTVVILDAPEIAESFRRAIELKICDCSRGSGERRYCIQFHQVASVRCAAVFSLSADTAMGKRHLGALRVANSPDPCFEFLQEGVPTYLANVPFAPGEVVTFHLQSTADSARDRVDIAETWVGELTLDPITVGSTPCR